MTEDTTTYNTSELIGLVKSHLPIGFSEYHRSLPTAVRARFGETRERMSLEKFKTLCTEANDRWQWTKQFTDQPELQVAARAVATAFNTTLAGLEKELRKDDAVAEQNISTASAHIKITLPGTAAQYQWRIMGWLLKELGRNYGEVYDFWHDLVAKAEHAVPDKNGIVALTYPAGVIHARFAAYGNNGHAFWRTDPADDDILLAEAKRALPPAVHRTPITWRSQERIGIMINRSRGTIRSFWEYLTELAETASPDNEGFVTLNTENGNIRMQKGAVAHRGGKVAWRTDPECDEAVLAEARRLFPDRAVNPRSAKDEAEDQTRKSELLGATPENPGSAHIKSRREQSEHLYRSETLLNAEYAAQPELDHARGWAELTGRASQGHEDQQNVQLHIDGAAEFEFRGHNFRLREQQEQNGEWRWALDENCRDDYRAMIETDYRLAPAPSIVAKAPPTQLAATERELVDTHTGRAR